MNKNYHLKYELSLLDNLENKQHKIRVGDLSPDLKEKELIKIESEIKKCKGLIETYEYWIDYYNCNH